MTNQLLKKLEDDFVQTTDRVHYLPTNPLPYQPKIFETTTMIRLQQDKVYYVEGDTRDLNFWRVLRNFIVKTTGSNDDWQHDNSSFQLQRDLIKACIHGPVKIALIGADETEEKLRELGVEALKDNYTPIYWDCCADIWCVNQVAQQKLQIIQAYYQEILPDIKDLRISL